MILSKGCIYGIQAATYVAAQPVSRTVGVNGPGSVTDSFADSVTEYVPISLIAEKLDISFHFLTKVLQQLTQAGILASYRGPKGGVSLARPAEQVTLYDMICAIDGKEIFEGCLLGLPGCGRGEPCPAHENWQPVRERLTAIARQTLLSALASKATELNLRIVRELGVQVTPVQVTPTKVIEAEN